MEMIKQLSKSVKIIGGLISIFIIFCVVSTIISFLPKHVDNVYIIKQIRESSELTTSKVTYAGLYHYEDSGARFINKGDFSILYEAVIRIGIDVSNVDVNTNNLTKKITIKIPSAEILDVNINEETVQFFDSKFAPFNFDTREDVTDVLSKTKEDAVNKMVDKIDYEIANKQSELLIKGIIENITPKDYEIKVIFK